MAGYKFVFWLITALALSLGFLWNFLALIPLSFDFIPAAPTSAEKSGAGVPTLLSKANESSGAKLSPESYPLHAGFPIYYDEWTEAASVTIADINHDGHSELLLPTYTGNIHAWNASGGELAGFPIRNPGWHLRGQPALGDLNGDGSLEIAAGLESPNPGVGGRIAIWRANGALLPGWPQQTTCARADTDCGVAAVILADLNKDATLDVIAGTSNRDLTTADPSRYVPNLYVWRADGQLAPGDWPNEDDHNVAIIGRMAVGDLDGDSYPDIVTGRDYNRLFAFDRLGAHLSGWPRYVWWPYDANDWNDDQIEFPRSSPALADLDLDGQLEYVVPGHRRSANSAIYYAPDLLIYTKSGVRWPGWELPASGGPLISEQTTRMIEAPAIGDLTGDGKPEIVLGTQDGYIRAYTAEKQVLWAYNYAQGKQIHTSEAVIGDVDGDGRNDVVFGTFAIYLNNAGPVGIHILDQNGTPKPGTPLWTHAPGISSSPALGDLDGDGLIEIAAADYSGWLYVWDAPGAALPQRLPWPMARHDLQRTGRYVALAPNYSRSSFTASRLFVNHGERVAFTLRVVQAGAMVDETLTADIAIPPGLVYVPGSLQATLGTVDAARPALLRWSGALGGVAEAVITYQADVGAGAAGGLVSQATISGSQAGAFTRRATIFAGGSGVFAPLLPR